MKAGAEKSRVSEGLELAEEFGADHTINIEEFNTPETRLGRVRELTDGRGADVVMMLRLQRERMDGGFIPSEREYYHRWGLDAEKLALAAPDAIVMHPGPMNRGVEITSSVADHPERSAITEQVAMGVAVRMACLDVLTRSARGVVARPRAARRLCPARAPAARTR